MAKSYILFVMNPGIKISLSNGPKRLSHIILPDKESGSRYRDFKNSLTNSRSKISNSIQQLNLETVLVNGLQSATDFAVQLVRTMLFQIAQHCYLM
jgi:hypothetical protein